MQSYAGNPYKFLHIIEIIGTELTISVVYIVGEFVLVLLHVIVCSYIQCMNLLSTYSSLGIRATCHLFFIRKYGNMSCILSS